MGIIGSTLAIVGFTATVAAVSFGSWLLCWWLSTIPAANKERSRPIAALADKAESWNEFCLLRAVNGLDRVERHFFGLLDVPTMAHRCRLAILWVIGLPSGVVYGIGAYAILAYAGAAFIVLTWRCFLSSNNISLHLMWMLGFVVGGAAVGIVLFVGVNSLLKLSEHLWTYAKLQ